MGGTTIVEAGRKVSTANRKILTAAMEAIAAVLAADDTEDGDGESKPKEAAAARARVVNLEEARNMGDWLEARLHMSFTETADMLFGEGRLSRDERVALSAAIGGALDAFRAGVEKGAPDLYQRDIFADPGATIEEAAIVGDFVPLLEGAAVRADGTALLKIIAPGWGASGYYPAAVLKRDGPAVFTKGVKGYWNHPTPTEEAERPEGDLSTLASELITDAKWQDQGPAGAGLYAETKVFTPFQAAVNELAPHIGVSIRAAGRTVQGEVQGRKGPIVDQLVAARSVDWVTVPGAGGQVIQLFEAARNRPAATTQANNGGSMEKETQDKLTEAQTQIAAQAAQIALMRDAQMLRDARDLVREALATVEMPDVARARLLEKLSDSPPSKDGALDREALTAKLTAAAKDEQAYLAQAAGYGSGRIAGMGESQAADAKIDVGARLAAAFAEMGLTEADAKIAAAGYRR